MCKAIVVVPDSFGIGSSSLITTIFSSSSSSSSSTGLISTLPRARLAKKVMDVLKCHLEDEVAKETLPSVNPHGRLSCCSLRASEHHDMREKQQQTPSPSFAVQRRVLHCPELLYLSYVFLTCGYFDPRQFKHSKKHCSKIGDLKSSSPRPRKRPYREQKCQEEEKAQEVTKKGQLQRRPQDVLGPDTA